MSCVLRRPNLHVTGEENPRKQNTKMFGGVGGASNQHARRTASSHLTHSRRLQWRALLIMTTTILHSNTRAGCWHARNPCRDRGSAGALRADQPRRRCRITIGHTHHKDQARRFVPSEAKIPRWSLSRHGTNKKTMQVRRDKHRAVDRVGVGLGWRQPELSGGIHVAFAVRSKRLSRPSSVRCTESTKREIGERRLRRAVSTVGLSDLPPPLHLEITRTTDFEHTVDVLGVDKRQKCPANRSSVGARAEITPVTRQEAAGKPRLIVGDHPPSRHQRLEARERDLTASGWTLLRTGDQDGLARGGVGRRDHRWEETLVPTPEWPVCRAHMSVYPCRLASCVCGPPRVAGRPTTSFIGGGGSDCPFRTLFVP